MAGLGAGGDFLPLLLVRCRPHHGVAERSLGVDAGQGHDLVARREGRLRLRDHHVSIAKDRDQRRVGREAQLVERSAGVGRILGQAHLDQRDLPALEPEEAHEVADRDRLLDHRGQDVGRRHGCVHAPLLVEEPLVLGVVHAREHPRYAELLLREQRRHEVVLVVAGRGDDHVGGPHVRLLEDARFARVAVHHVGVGRPVLELLREVAPLLDERHVVAPLGQVLGEVPSHRTTTGHDDLHAWSLCAMSSSTRSSPSFAIMRIR